MPGVKAARGKRRGGIKDITHSYFLLDSPIIKKTEDLYGPVRFKHRKHTAQLKDCALCHHRRPLDDKAKETTRCSACHQEAFRPDQPERLGLKAAFHQQCTGCHQDLKKARPTAWAATAKTYRTIRSW